MKKKVTNKSSLIDKTSKNLAQTKTLQLEFIYLETNYQVNQQNKCAFSNFKLYCSYFHFHFILEICSLFW